MTDKNQIQQAAQTVHCVKQESSKKERLRDWQAVRTQQNLSGEFVVSAKLGEKAFTEEQIKWISEMYGR